MQVARPGAYRLDLRVRPAGTPGRFTLKLGADPLGAVAVSPVAGPAAWQTFSLTTAPLPAGRHTLRLCVEQPVGQVGWLRFSPADAPASPGGQ